MLYNKFYLMIYILKTQNMFSKQVGKTQNMFGKHVAKTQNMLLQ